MCQSELTGHGKRIFPFYPRFFVTHILNCWRQKEVVIE